MLDLPLLTKALNSLTRTELNLLFDQIDAASPFTDVLCLKRHVLCAIVDKDYSGQVAMPEDDDDRGPSSLGFPP